MNTQKIINELLAQYPEKKIILDPPDNPTEIICEIQPTLENPKESIALAIVGKSKPHYHKKSTEVYESVRGTLTLYKDGEKNILKEGEKITIEPHVIHHVEGDETWFLTYSTPGWTTEDHIRVSELKTNAILTCPLCGSKQRATMPTNACQYFYECVHCSKMLKPKQRECCVFCSYADTKCPPKQLGKLSS